MSPGIALIDEIIEKKQWVHITKTLAAIEKTKKFTSSNFGLKSFTSSNNHRVFKNWSKLFGETFIKKESCGWVARRSLFFIFFLCHYDDEGRERIVRLSCELDSFETEKEKIDFLDGQKVKMEMKENKNIDEILPFALLVEEILEEKHEAFEKIEKMKKRIKTLEREVERSKKRPRLS